MLVTIGLYVLWSVSILLSICGLDCYNCGGFEMTSLDSCNGLGRHLEHFPAAGLSGFDNCQTAIKFVDGQHSTATSHATKNESSEGRAYIIDNTGTNTIDFICACFEDKCNGSCDLEFMSAIYAFLIYINNVLTTFSILITML